MMYTSCTRLIRVVALMLAVQAPSLASWPDDLLSADVDPADCVHSAASGVPALPGDINGDNHVNVFDLQLLAATWNKQLGQPGFNPEADFNCDGRINVFDLQIMASNWNT